MLKVKRALISVFDKRNLVEFARSLTDLNIEIISTTGTAKLLLQNNIKVTKVEDLTKFPELLNGRVKTLHPYVHASILSTPAHLQALEKLGIAPIEMVVVNLYPFEKIICESHTIEDAVENIDIGGVTLIRSAAKNFRNVAVVVDTERYSQITTELRTGGIREETLQELGIDAFRYTATYDSIIYNYFQNLYRGETFPETYLYPYKKAYTLKYGENSHQRAALYFSIPMEKRVVANAQLIYGNGLSFNNILDNTTTCDLLAEFERPTAVIIKHMNPCGVASSDNLTDAYKLAYESDSVSAYGGVVGLNRRVDEQTATLLRSVFIDSIIAPEYDENALNILKKKKKIRILSAPIQKRKEKYDTKQISGGILVQEIDRRELKRDELKVMTNRYPTEDELSSLMFAWKVVRYVKSNGIVLAKDNHTVGIGAGQMSRVMAVKIAIEKAGIRSKGAVMASDAFFPFKDGIEEAGKSGVRAVIQPGGSIRDSEVIETANEYDIAMVFTGWRVFRH